MIVDSYDIGVVYAYYISMITDNLFLFASVYLRIILHLYPLFLCSTHLPSLFYFFVFVCLNNNLTYQNFHHHVRLHFILFLCVCIIIVSFLCLLCSPIGLLLHVLEQSVSNCMLLYICVTHGFFFFFCDCVIFILPRVLHSLSVFNKTCTARLTQHLKDKHSCQIYRFFCCNNEQDYTRSF